MSTMFTFSEPLSPYTWSSGSVWKENTVQRQQLKLPPAGLVLSQRNSIFSLLGIRLILLQFTVFAELA